MGNNRTSAARLDGDSNSRDFSRNRRQARPGSSRHAPAYRPIPSADRGVGRLPALRSMSAGIGSTRERRREHRRQRPEFIRPTKRRDRPVRQWRCRELQWHLAICRHRMPFIGSAAGDHLARQTHRAKRKRTRRSRWHHQHDRLRQWRHSNGSRAAVRQRGIRNIQAVKRLPRYLDGDQAIGRGGDRRRDRSDHSWRSVRTCINNGSKVDNRQRYCRWREWCGDWKHDRRRASARLRTSDVLRWMVRADRTLARDLHRPSQVHGKCWCCSGALSKGRNFFAIKSEVNDHLRDLASNSREIANEHSPRCKRRHVEHRS
jgi:hypothetical protein